MKIGILTFHKSINCGSVLQVYALSKLLEKIGYKVEVIDYEPKIYKEQYGIFVKCISIKSVLKNAKKLVIFDILKLQKRAFETFRENYLNESKDKYQASSQFECFNHNYECIICGSDQIWNVRAVDCDPVYFLPIKHIGKKIAYAVSINNTDFTEEICNDNLRKNIEDFDFISVREETGAKKLFAFLGHEKEIKVSLDPTLLHKKEMYENISSNRLVKQPYIFLYSIDCKEDVLEAAKLLSNKYSIPVYTFVVTKSNKVLLRILKYGIRILRRNNGPTDFISYIRYADYVVTNSFHGTAFSIIFEKYFIAINDRNPDGSLKNDERIINILNSLELQNRYLTVDTVNHFDIDDNIDFKSVTDKRMKLAKKSCTMLVNAINGKGNQ